MRISADALQCLEGQVYLKPNEMVINLDERKYVNVELLKQFLAKHNCRYEAETGTLQYASPVFFGKPVYEDVLEKVLDEQENAHKMIAAYYYRGDIDGMGYPIGCVFYKNGNDGYTKKTIDNCGFSNPISTKKVSLEDIVTEIDAAKKEAKAGEDTRIVLDLSHKLRAQAKSPKQDIASKDEEMER